MTATVTLLTISSVVPSTVSDTEQLVIARWKDTDKRPISAANRARCVTLPANQWSGNSEVTALSDSLKMFVLDAVSELAVSYLRTIVEDGNWQRTEVNADAFSLASLLQWSGEQAAISGRLNGDEIKKWLATSVTISTVSEKHGKDIATALGNQFVKLASPNHGLTPEKAEKLLTTLWQANDADSTTGLRVQLRLQAIRDKAQESANVLDSIL